MNVNRSLAPIVLLSAALLAGCSQGASPDTGSTPAAGSATTEMAQEAAPTPAMTNWQATAFYERPATEIAGDLELLGFTVEDEGFIDQEEPHPDFYYLTFVGTPDDNPLADVDEHVYIDLSVENPSFDEGATEQTLESLADGTVPNGATFSFYHASADSSEYEGIAEQVIDAFGMTPMTSSTLTPFGIDDTIVGNFSGASTAFGTDNEYTVSIMETSENVEIPNPDMTLGVSLSLFYVAPTN